jgi:hypothetical protein
VREILRRKFSQSQQIHSGTGYIGADDGEVKPAAIAAPVIVSKS